MFWFYAQYLKLFRPKGFLFENVKGILQSNKSRDWEIIKKSFNEIGYNLYFRILDAADFGTPQHRERLIMVGCLDEINFKFPRPVYGQNSSDRKPYVTPRIAFSDIDDPTEIVPMYSGKYGHLLADIPPGLNYLYYTERMKHPSPLFAWRSKFSGFLYKLSPDEPSKTLVAHQGKYDGPFHWKNRKLNKEELIRIQGFPLDYRFTGSRISVEKQIGNSVAPKLASYLAKSVSKQIFNNEVCVDLLEHDQSLIKKKKSRIGRIPLDINMNNNEACNFDFFQKIIDWPREETSLPIHEDDFYNKCILNNGEWIIHSSKKKKCELRINISIKFCQAISDKFEKIICDLDTDNELDFNIAWDFIHKLISYSCSYESLQPLYGHFTEPYPKFSVKTFVNSPNSGIGLLMERMADFSYLSKIHRCEELFNIFNNDIDLIETVRLLRNKGVDIRIHETNRTIPENHFRICYPFCLPSWQQTYTKWIDIGNHKTGDLKIEKLMGSN